MKRTPFHSQSWGYTNIFEIYSPSICHPSSCARHALNLYLKSNGKDKTIYLPDFICRDILAVFYENNMNVKFFSVTKSLQPNFSHNVKCDFLLMVNFFGFPQDIDTYRKFAKKSNAILIEDNAHGLFSKDKKHELLGKRGDIGILSVRKSVTLPDTGMLLINNKKIKKIEDSPKYKREALSTFVKRMAKHLFRLFPRSIPVSLLFIRNYLRKLTTGEFWPRGDPTDEFMLPKNRYINKYFSKGTIPGNINKEIEYRRRSYMKIETLANKFKISRPFQKLEAEIVPYGFPYFIEDNSIKVNLFEKEIKKMGFFSIYWPTLPTGKHSKNFASWYDKIKIVQFQW